MNSEEARLQTFSDWPSDAAVSPTRIAKAGFFSTRQGLEVECFACNLKISEWNYGDQVMYRHIALSPTCPFVLNPSTSGNVPMISPNVPSSSSRSPYRYRDERVRLESFENWPAGNIVSPERLARAGFYYLREGDNTKCAYCKGIVRAWEPGDDPDAEHKRHFPNCPFVISTINQRLNVPSADPQGDFSIEKEAFPNVNLVTNERNLGELGVQAHKGPKRSDYATVEARLGSFVGWSSELLQTPDILSQAGFYYEGLGDQVRCFHCDGGLKHWDPHDDPWTEHARWFPNCSFVKLVKGQEFVTASAVEHGTGSGVRDSSQKVQNLRRRREVTERELQELMTSPPALAALSIGLNVERVKRAIKEKLEQTGKAYSQPDALVEAALNLQHDEEDISNDQDPSHVNNGFREAVSSVLQSIVKDTEPRVVASASVVVDNPIGNSSDAAPRLEKTVSLEEENRILKEARLCKICMDGEVGIVFLPCGHLATCVNCAPNLEDCPVCRSSIKATVRTFLS
ncbi:hypothetical protein NQ315_008662 [Exocentrus adspersus]|uniref:RING-type domain-containing protein n=1 Tax=Exocentrus adspersus TaxID=1586481 RepID=A0AAV8W6D8_9CUCU|nr:hypothetical protein NQ315_008662 [Exocentrus adspersus]